MPPTASPTSPITSGDGAMATTHTVPVVPMFAPIMTFIACESVIIPEDTNPTTIAVIIADDCAIKVETMPVPTPARR